ncbi:hypothetical protein C0992_009765 [Termitomyces sp. T32_za158]|nr:hypothetical protein C0992_009765 [Termitomyces sp. T32_za158]
MLKRHDTFSLVGALLGATVATLVVWYYNRGITDPHKAKESAFNKAPTTAKEDSSSPCAGASHGRLTVNSPCDATSRDNISTVISATSRDGLQVISGATVADRFSTTSAAVPVPSGSLLATAVASPHDSLQAIPDAAQSDSVSITSATTTSGYPPRLLTATTPGSRASILAATVPGAGLSKISRRISGRTESSQQHFHTASASLSRQPPDCLSEPLCVVRMVMDEDEPVQGIIIAIERTTLDQVESYYEDCKSHLMNTERPLQVTVMINRGDKWSLAGLEQYSQALARLAEDDKHRLCKTLSVKLPMTDDLESNEGVADLVLPEVVSLNWESHAYQLPLIGLGNFTHLRNLEVRSRLSFRDCQLLLQCASQTLESCQIAQVIDNSGGTYAFPKKTCATIELAASDPVVMRELAFLSIDSVLCPGEMLQKFRFRALKVLKLSVQYDFDPERNMNSIPWVGLEEVRMHCHFVYGGAAWVEKNTPNATTKKISIVRNPGV